MDSKYGLYQKSAIFQQQIGNVSLFMNLGPALREWPLFMIYFALSWNQKPIVEGRKCLFMLDLNLSPVLSDRIDFYRKRVPLADSLACCNALHNLLFILLRPYVLIVTDIYFLNRSLPCFSQAQLLTPPTHIVYLNFFHK